jgi:hypothetical protein
LFEEREKKKEKEKSKIIEKKKKKKKKVKRKKKEKKKKKKKEAERTAHPSAAPRCRLGWPSIPISLVPTSSPHRACGWENAQIL